MGKSYGWVIVAAGGLIGCIAAGSMFALAVISSPSPSIPASRAEISTAMTLVFIVMGVSVQATSDRFGPARDPFGRCLAQPRPHRGEQARRQRP